MDLAIQRGTKQMQQNLIYCFFLFVNSGSGSNTGIQLLKQQIQLIQFIIPYQYYNQKKATLSLKCRVYIYNMKKNKQDGFNTLKKQMQEKDKKCYAIVCGGDGTVMWVVSQLVKSHIQIKNIPIGIIPLGTGNDFSRELGWGSISDDLIQNSFKKLKQLVKKWIRANQDYFDVWDIQAEIFQDGKFQKIQNNRSVTVEGDTLIRTFCNYFSFGIDGKIGYGFDKHRTKSRLGNLAMYACIGLAKTMTKTKTLDQLLDTIEISDGYSNGGSLQYDSVQLNSVNSQSFNSVNSSKKSVLIKSESECKKQKNVISNQKYFANDFKNILALNIDSYTGGVKGIWNAAKKGFVKNSQNQINTDISTCDGKLEIVTFGSSIGIAMERTFGGFSKRVTQGEGPFIFNFKRCQKKPKHRTYLQIDGQFLRFTNPKKVTISVSKLVPNGKIKVLRNVKVDENF